MEEWAKDLAEKISAARYSNEELDPKSLRIVKLAEEARKDAPKILFDMFIDRVEAVSRHIEPENRGLISRLFRKSTPPSVLIYSIIEEQTFRFQIREAWCDR